MNAYDDIEPDPFDDCPGCGGSGGMWDEDINDFTVTGELCPRCNGTGRAQPEVAS